MLHSIVEVQLNRTCTGSHRVKNNEKPVVRIFEETTEAIGCKIITIDNHNKNEQIDKHPDVS